MSKPDFKFKMDPFPHQLEFFERTRDMKAHAIFWEQGVAKTKPTIDTACWLFLKGEINAVLVVAPNGVDENWVTDELPKHVPDEIMERSTILRYDTSRHQNKAHEQACRRLIHEAGLTWLVMSYDAFMTGPVKTGRKNNTHKWMGGKKFVWEYLKRRRVMYVLDESIEIKSPGAKRTKSVVASGKYAPYTRILNGTPIAVGPFDIYKQVQFLDENFWKDRNFSTLTEFKAHFGVWRPGARGKGRTSDDMPAWDLGDLVSYRRLDELYEILQPISSRLLKKDVLDIPEKLYSKLYFEMNPQQRRVYEDVENEAMAFLEDGGLVTAPLPITQLLRARQIASGYVPPDDPEDEPVKMLGKTNPRLKVMLEQCERTPHKAIIWCNFTLDVELLLRGLGSAAVPYYGQISDDQKAANKHAFKNDRKIQFIVANQRAMSRGHTLTEAWSAYYYNNSFSYVDRVQSEDRCHRAGLTHPVDYIDVVGCRVDNKIVANLRKKMRIANEITGDEEKEWI